MTRKERQSCICTINTLRRLALNIHGVIDVVDDANCDKLIELLNGEADGTVNQEPCEEWHDVPSDEMTLGQARQAVKDLRRFVMDNHILPNLQPCEDAISRQAVLEIIEREQFKGDTISEIEKLPPVQPKAKVGHWIRVDKTKVKCSECEVISFIAMYPNGDKNFCPNCGTKMEVEE